MTKPTKIDFAQLAAFLDGEGTISITKSSAYRGESLRFRVEIMVTNTDPRLMAWLKDRFGGNVGRGGRHGTHFKCFKWRLPCKKAHDVLVKCLPYFVLKRHEAEIAIQFRRTVASRGKKLSAETLNERHLLRMAIQESRTRHLQKSGEYVN